MADGRRVAADCEGAMETIGAYFELARCLRMPPPFTPPDDGRYVHKSRGRHGTTTTITYRKRVARRRAKKGYR